MLKSFAIVPHLGQNVRLQLGRAHVNARIVKIEFPHPNIAPPHHLASSNTILHSQSTILSSKQRTNDNVSTLSSESTTSNSPTHSNSPQPPPAWEYPSSFYSSDVNDPNYSSSWIRSPPSHSSFNLPISSLLTESIFPTVGPLSHLHYHIKNHHKHHSSNETTQPEALEKHQDPQQNIPPYYFEHERGKLLPLKQHETYHSHLNRSAQVVCAHEDQYARRSQSKFSTRSNVANVSDNPSAKAAPAQLIDESIVDVLLDKEDAASTSNQNLDAVATAPLAIDEELFKLSSVNWRMLKSTRATDHLRALKRGLSISQKASDYELLQLLSKGFAKVYLQTQKHNFKTPGSYTSPNDQVASALKREWGHQFTIDDLLFQIFAAEQNESRQSIDPLYASGIFPKLDFDKVILYEEMRESVREWFESRWSHFQPAISASSSSVAFSSSLDSLTSSLWMKMHQALSYHRKEDIAAFVQNLKPILADKRKNKALPPRNPDISADDQEAKVIVFEDNIKLPTVFESATRVDQLDPPSEQIVEGPKSLIDIMENDSETDRMIIMALALFANSTPSHPIPSGLHKVLASNVLLPLGYPTSTQGAQLLLTHLGLNLVDPFDVPFLFELSHQLEVNKDDTYIQYPWNKDALKLSLMDILSTKSPTNKTIELEQASSRLRDIPSASNLSNEYCASASKVLVNSADGLETSHPWNQALKAGEHHKFSWTKHAPSFVDTKNSIEFIKPPVVWNDSSELVKSVDLDALGRKDFSWMPSFAIDDQSTTEVDDAFSIDLSAFNSSHIDWIRNHLIHYCLWLRKHQKNLSSTSVKAPPAPPSDMPRNVTIYVHIADPTAVMRPGDSLESCARERVETLYLPHRKSVMMPSILSEFYCSLQPGEHKNIALTYVSTLDILTGKITSYDVVPSKFSNMKRLDYETVQRLLTNEDVSAPIPQKEKEALKVLFELSRTRTIHRVLDKNAFQMNLLNTDVAVDRETSTTGLVDDVNNQKSRTLVEEMMVMVGEIGALLAKDHDLPVPYRAQSMRSSIRIPNYHPVIDIINGGSGYEAFDELDLVPSAKLVSSNPASKNYLIHNLQCLTYMLQAETTSIPLPHVSLGLERYSRGSSPLRRYADVLTHFQLKAFKRNMSSLPYSKAEIHTLSQHIDKVSKDLKFTSQMSERWWKSMHVLREGMDKLWDALVFYAPSDASFLYSSDINSRSRNNKAGLCILDLNIIIYTEANSAMEVGKIVKLKPQSLNDLTLDWKVVSD